MFVHFDQYLHISPHFPPIPQLLAQPFYSYYGFLVGLISGRTKPHIVFLRVTYCIIYNIKYADFKYEVYSAVHGTLFLHLE